MAASKLNELITELENNEENSIVSQICSLFQAELKAKDSEINSLKEDVRYLSKQFNEQERYNSKNCIFVSNLPLTSGISNFKDVTQFLREYLGIVVQETDLQACHPLGKFTDRRQPPNVLVRFLHFYSKDRIWARKYQLKGKMNPINNKPIYLRERLTKADSDLLDYARGLGCVTTSMNPAPQFLVKTSFGKKSSYRN